MVYFKFTHQLTIEPARGLLWKMFRADKNEEDVNIEYWYVEYDIDNDYVNRELGFDKNHKVVYYAPSETFYGFWSDANADLTTFDRFNPEDISDVEFFQHWKDEYELK